MGPLAAIYLASRLLREATPLLTDHEPVKPKPTVIDKPLNHMTDAEVMTEWHKWNNKIVNSTSWGAALTAAGEFRKECASELRLRNILVPGNE